MTLPNQLVFSLLLMMSSQAACTADSLVSLADDFWHWRGQIQPSSGDDIPRISRAPDWVPDWTPAAITTRYTRLQQFEHRWQALGALAATASDKTDYRLLGSALARVRWELDHVAAWRHQPCFYLEQSLTPVFTLLLKPPPLEAARRRQLLNLLQQVPVTLLAAQENLDEMRRPFVNVCLMRLKKVTESLAGLETGLQDQLNSEEQARLQKSIAVAAKAFQDFQQFLHSRTSGLPTQTAVGPDSYAYFLKHVALYPYSTEQLLLMSEQEWARMVSFEKIEQQANADLPVPQLAESLDAILNNLAARESYIRDFLLRKNLLSIPAEVRHYSASAFPDYLAPLAWLGRTYDMTAPDRMHENATVYLHTPSPELGYFNRSFAQDPGPVIVHEGIPGHYLQKVLSWRNENPMRHHYYDSGANEGIGFYAEEMLLQAGLFDDAPRSREIIYNFARLRALRVEVDVKLALGEFTISEAASYLQRRVPMDRASAEHEAIFFAASPGQAISYQVGKLQVLEFLARARHQKGDAFILKDFHDYLWRNGNVPISLLMDEYLVEN